jgi:hypothetical protein
MSEEEIRDLAQKMIGKSRKEVLEMTQGIGPEDLDRILQCLVDMLESKICPDCEKSTVKNICKSPGVTYCDYCGTLRVYDLDLDAHTVYTCEAHQQLKFLETHSN